MAIENAKTLNVRIKNKYDSYENWAKSGLVLEAGEIAIAYTTVNVDIGNGKIEQHPELLMKVGDGENTFANLPWLSAKAADVATWAKAAEKPTYAANEITGISDYIADYVSEEMGIEVDTDTQYQIVKVDDYNYKLQSKGKGAEGWADVANSVIVIPNDTDAIKALEDLVGTIEVATQISDAITELDLANTYAAKSHTHTKSEITDFAHEHAISDVTGLQDALDGKQAAGDYAAEEHTHAISEVTGLSDAIADAKKAGTDAQTYAEGVAGNLSTLSGKVGDVTDGKTVVEMIADAQAAATYDDTELAGRVSDLEALVGEDSVADQITDALSKEDGSAKYATADALATEAETARAAEGANAKAITDLANGAVKANTEAIAKLNGDDKTEGSVDYKVAQEVAKILNDNDATDIDTLEEIAAWIKNDTAGVGALNKNVTDNAAAIAKLNGDASIEGSVAKSIADAIAEENLDQYATDDDLGALDDRVTTVEGLVGKASVEGGDAATGLYARVETAEEDIAALEGLVGETAVATQISDAIDGALMVAGAEEGTKVEKYALATALADTDTEVAKKANTDDLAAIAFSGSTDDLVQGSLVLVFDCGTSAI